MSDATVTSICYFNGQWGTGAGAADDLAHQRGLARQHRLRRRPGVRRGGARSRPALPAGDPLGARSAPAADGHRRADRGAGPRGHRAGSRPTRRSTSGRCSGPRAGWCCSTRPRPSSRWSSPRCPARPGQGASRRACRPTGGPAPSRRRPTPRRRACIRWPDWPSPRRSERGFDNAVMCDPIGNVAELTAQNIMFAQGRRLHHADSERHLPQRHHPPARDRPAARRRRRR